MPSAGRLGLRTAGKQIQTSVRAASAALLDGENAAFEGIEVAFGTGVRGMKPKVEAAIRAAGGEPGKIATKRALLADLEEAHLQALDDSRAVVQAMAEAAHDIATGAIGEELLLCERTQAKRYAGVADEAVDAMAVGGSAIVETYMDAYDEAVAPLTRLWVNAVLLQVKAAPDERQAILRLFSPDPAGLKGFGGRGVWWQSMSSVKVQCRAVSISVSNRTRLNAMSAFNTQAAERD